MDDSTYTTENLDNLKALEDDTTSIKKRTKKNHKFADDDFFYRIKIPYIDLYGDPDKFREREKYMIKRKDGGEYIAHATVYNEEIEKCMERCIHRVGCCGRSLCRFPDGLSHLRLPCV